MNLYYDRQGKPFKDLLEWAARFEDDKYKRVLYTVLPDGSYVSTVWLGLDHSFGGGPPLIFETMVFKPRTPEEIEERRKEYLAQSGTLGIDFSDAMKETLAKAPADLEQQRYATEDEAIVGHWEIVLARQAKLEAEAKEAEKDEKASEHSGRDARKNGRSD